MACIRLAACIYPETKDMKRNILMTLFLLTFMGADHKTMAQSINTQRPDSGFYGTHWTLQSIAGQDIPLAAREAYIVFDGEKQAAYGSSGCNRMTGKFTLEGGRLTIGPMAGTRMACDEASMRLEEAFHKALVEVDGFSIEGNKLFLKKGDSVVAELQAADK
jgi:heat shock protein HslJ